MWIAVIAVALIILGFGLVMTVLFFVWVNYMGQIKLSLEQEFDEPEFYKEEKPCGLIDKNSKQCDFTQDYLCGSCDSGV